MSHEPLILRGLATLSPLGASAEECARAVQRHVPVTEQLSGVPTFPLAASALAKLREVQLEPRFEGLDRAALLAIAAARESRLACAGRVPVPGCVSIGSARGATHSLERTMRQHLLGEEALAPHTSPLTTAGNISSWVAQDGFGRSTNGGAIASIGTSMTCTSAFHSLLIAHAFVRSGMASSALFGGTESCLTEYTIAQLKALRIYSRGGAWPCTPCLRAETLANSVTLGEGAGCAFLLKADGTFVPGDMTLLGLGWSLESTPSATGISEDGEGFATAMRNAICGLPPGRRVDCVVLHAPGTSKGDEAELRAVRRVLPHAPMCTTKHLTGHTYGASGMVSLALAQALLGKCGWPGFPYPSQAESVPFEAPRTVLINTAGFGGNSIAVIVGAPNPLPAR